MLKKCAILGIAVLLVGGGALGWLIKETRSEEALTRHLRTKYAIEPEEYLNKYGHWHRLNPEQQTQLVLEMDKDRQGKSRQQLAEEQKARLRVDIERLAAGQVISGEIAEFLYGPGWKEEVRKYKKLREQKEIARTASIVCISIGGAILSGCCVVWLAYALMRFARAIRVWRLRPKGETSAMSQVPELTEIHMEAPAEAPTVAQAEPASKPRGLSSVPQSKDVPEPNQRSLRDEGFLPRTLGTYTTTRRPTLMARKAEDPTTLLMSDEASSQEWSPDLQWSTPTIHDDGGTAVVGVPQFSHQSAVSTLEPEEPAPKAKSDLQEQAEDLQKQLTEFKQMAQSVQQATREQSSPLSSTLKELAEQVSAIRDYAASQQNRVEKLQDGYDWGIIRTFCLRVIRCIDNIEKRIEDLGQDDEVTAYMEEIRDEMLFALESSGVEPFVPELNSDYRGQEKLAEAVKEKQASSEPDHAGKIAKVLRSGYRYMIDDENYKIVRTAQVKLFG